MARFKDHKLPDGTAPQTAWATVKRYLLGAETVEVVVRYDTDDNPTAIVLRVWDDVRKDDSNAADADPDADY